MSTSSADGWSLLLDLSTISKPVSPDEHGLFIGNGKIGLLSSFDSFDMESCMITTQLKYYNGQYKSVMLEPFYMTHVKFFDNDASKVNIEIQNQSLDMKGAVFKNQGHVTRLQDQAQVSVECDTYTPYQLPFCIVQSYTIRPLTDMAEFDLFHEPYAKDSIIDVEYNNNVVYNEKFNSNQGIYLLSGKGRARNNGEQVAAGSVYLFDTGTDAQNLGYNMYRADVNRCYNKFRISNMQAGVAYKFHIVSSILTSADFDSPGEEVKKIVLNILNRAPGTGALLKVRAEHVNMWSDLWKTDLRVIAKSGITMGEGDKIKRLQKGVRYSLYNIFSCMRENINLEVNPLNLSVIDYDGSVLYNGDIWLIPILLLLKPEMARGLLEYRYHMLTVARQLASGYGYKGSKFPYLNDSVGYKNSLYYDIAAPLSLFNTALISINVWNYFRISHDRDWLMSRGYPILKENADFFASRIERDSDGTFHLRNVVALDNQESSDKNAFTNNLVKLALRFAIEASYELTYHVKETWMESYYNLDISYVKDSYNTPTGKMMFDVDDLPTSKYSIMEPLLNLLPYYAYLYWLPEMGHGPVNIKENLDLYLGKLKPGAEDHPYNLASAAVCYGQYAQYEQQYVQQYEQYLYEFLDNYSIGIWKHLAFSDKRNDLIMNSILLFILLQGMSKLNIHGGVAETRFYYEEMRVTGETSANMPKSWNKIRVSGKGERILNVCTTNILTYT